LRRHTLVAVLSRASAADSRVIVALTSVMVGPAQMLGVTDCHILGVSVIGCQVTEDKRARVGPSKGR
jgi:hypothetical protein